MDYSSMTDSEMSREIAEKVMGWHQIENAGRFERWIRPDGHAHLGKTPNYATDIAQAFEVVEKFCKGKCASFKIICTAGCKWCVTIRYICAWSADEVIDDSLPRAICIAALEAVRGES